MNSSGNLESFVDEYVSTLRDAFERKPSASPRQLGVQLLLSGIPVSKIFRLHQLALARLNKEGLEPDPDKAGDFLVEVTGAYDADGEMGFPEDVGGEFFRQLFEEHPFPMWLFEESSLRFLYVNQAAISFYGYSLEEFLRRTILDICPEQYWNRLLDFIAQRPSNHSAKTEWRHRLKDGQIIDVEISSRRFPLEGKSVRLVICRDITARKQAEERLWLLEHAIDKAQDVILITEPLEDDSAGPMIIYVNEAFERMTGYSREEAIGNTPRMLQGPGTSFETRDAIRKALEEWRSIRVEMLNYRKDGTEFWVELAIQPIPDVNGKLTHWLSIQRDVTEIRREGERLRHAQKMEAVGQLTAGIAHNFNNLLTIIQGNAELIGRTTQLSQTLGLKKEAILKATRRGAELVRQLMIISRGSSHSPQALDVNSLVGETANLIERILPPNIRFSIQLSEQPLSANLDAVEFSQSLLNLIVNARNAMPHGGDLTISTGTRVVSESKLDRPGTVFILDRAKVQPGIFAEVVVADTGIGMTEKVRRRIFEPFFTTMPEGQGTGLGLATTLGFVSERGGFIEVTSEVGRGSIFRLLLPVLQTAPSAPPVARKEDVSFGGLTVLVAEDDPAIQHLATIILQDKGFRVLTAKDGAEAIRLATEFSETLHLVLADKALPTLYGDAVIRILSDLRPDCRFILTSGNMGIPENLPPHVHFLPKPFGQEDLVEALKAVNLEIPK